MGKDWDKAIPSVEIWRECLRVLKPGAFAFVMSIPRQDCLSRMIISLEDAGFNVSFSPIYHSFSQGFPKAGNVGKMIDRKLGAEREIIGKRDDGRYAHHFQNGNNPFVSAENNPRKEVDSKIGVIDKPSTPQAKALDGSYTFSPKPAVEVILCCQKPMTEKTYVGQALLWYEEREKLKAQGVPEDRLSQFTKQGLGSVWFDDGRIPYQDKTDKQSGICERESKRISPFTPLNTEKDTFDRSSRQYLTGRFPANLLVSNGALDDGKIRKSGKDINPTENTVSVFFGHGQKGYYNKEANYGDSGSFSRYFSLDKWWEERIKNLPASVQKTFPFLIVPKASKGEKDRGCEGLELKAKCDIDKMGGEKCTMKTGSGNVRNVHYLNYHPTVKPIRLFSYLITLGSREGDTILDPFVGTGTTCLAARMLGRRSIGIEIGEEYCEIAAQRCKQMGLGI